MKWTGLNRDYEDRSSTLDDPHHNGGALAFAIAERFADADKKRMEGLTRLCPPGSTDEPKKPVPLPQYVNIQGKWRSLRVTLAKHGISSARFRQRINDGWPMSKAATTPPGTAVPQKRRKP